MQFQGFILYLVKILNYFEKNFGHWANFECRRWPNDWKNHPSSHLVTLQISTITCTGWTGFKPWTPNWELNQRVDSVRGHGWLQNKALCRNELYSRKSVTIMTRYSTLSLPNSYYAFALANLQWTRTFSLFVVSIQSILTNL